MRSDLHKVGRTWPTQPDVRLSLPRDLPPELAPSAVYLSHYHWDHSGDPLTVPADVPIYVGPGTLEALKTGFDEYVGDQSAECVARLSEMPEGEVTVEGFPNRGHDVFGDGSFVVLPAPGVSTPHALADDSTARDTAWPWFARLPTPILVSGREYYRGRPALRHSDTQTWSSAVTLVTIAACTTRVPATAV
jgi:L-ascorbate metabolism protein UlaG (beta-lactamase superfamily)